MGYTATQWHLQDSNNAATAHVQAAWGRGIFGRGVRLAVVDDSLDVAHADIVAGCDRAMSVNFNSGDKTNPSPQNNEAHGTAAAAVAAASGMSSPPGSPRCGHGIAPLAILVGVRLIADPVGDADEGSPNLVGIHTDTAKPAD